MFVPVMALPPSAVVKQDIHRLLKHPFLVADDDFRRIELLQALQAVVPVDDPPVKIIQVGGGEPSAVQGHQRAKVRRDHGKDGQDHPLRFVSRLPQGLNHLQSLDVLFPLRLRNGVLQLRTEFVIQLNEIDLFEKAADRLGADAGFEGIRAVLILQVDILLVGQEILLFQRGVLGIEDDP